MELIVVFLIACVFKDCLGDFYVNVTQTGCISFDFVTNLDTDTINIEKDSTSVLQGIYTGADDIVLTTGNFTDRITNYKINRPDGTLSFCIVNTTIYDGGVYAIRISSTTKFSKTLYVLDIPLTPKISVIRNGTTDSESGVLSCLSFSTSAPPGLFINYNWSVNETSIKNWNKHKCNKNIECNELIITVDRNDKFNNYRCAATEQYGLTSKLSEIREINPNYFPYVHMEPKYNPYIVYQKQQNIELACVIEDANPLNGVTYEWKSPSGSAYSRNFTIPTVNRSHSGQYSCTATNIAGTSDKTHKQISVHYGPLISNIDNTQDITEGNNLTVSPLVDSYPAAESVWWTKQNDTGFRYDGYVLKINKIRRTSSGNYSCYVMNTLMPSGMPAVKQTTQKLFYVNVQYKPFLDLTRPYSPSYISAKVNNCLQITITIIANPTPTVEWTFKAEVEYNSYNFSTILSNTTINGILTSSSVSIYELQSHNFGDYTFTANNTVGIYFRRFVVIEEATLRPDMTICTKENTTIFVAGIATLVVGLLSLAAAVIVVVRISIKNKTIESPKFVDYTDVQRTNPTFSDPYTTLQVETESRSHKEQIGTTYEECEMNLEAYAYSSLETIKTDEQQP